MSHVLSNWDNNAADYVSKVKEKTTYSVGVVGGGTSVNSIPFESWATVDMRSEKVEHLHMLNDMLQSSIERAIVMMNANKTAGKDLTVHLEKIGDRPPGLTDYSSSLVQRAIAATEYFNKKYDLRASSTNSNLPMSLDIPAITMGQGGKSGGIHSLNEWWLDEEGDKAIQHILLVLLAECGYSQNH